MVAEFHCSVALRRKMQWAQVRVVRLRASTCTTPIRYAEQGTERDGEVAQRWRPWAMISSATHYTSANDQQCHPLP